MPDEILTLPEVAQLFKATENRLHDGSEEPTAGLQGAPTVEVPRRVDLDRWIEQQKEASRDEGRG